MLWILFNRIREREENMRRQIYINVVEAIMLLCVLHTRNQMNRWQKNQQPIFDVENPLIGAHGRFNVPATQTVISDWPIFVWFCLKFVDLVLGSPYYLATLFEISWDFIAFYLIANNMNKTIQLLEILCARAHCHTLNIIIHSQKQTLNV